MRNTDTFLYFLGDFLRKDWYFLDDDLPTTYVFYTSNHANYMLLDSNFNKTAQEI